MHDLKLPNCLSINNAKYMFGSVELNYIEISIHDYTLNPTMNLFVRLKLVIYATSTITS